MLKYTILILCLCAGSLIAKPALDESAAKTFITEASDRFAGLYNDIAQSIFLLTDLNSDDSKEEETKSDDTKNEISDSSSDELSSDEITGFFAFFLILSEIGKLRQATENMSTIAEEAYRFNIDQFNDEEIKIGLLKLKTLPGLIALGEKYYDWVEDDFDEFLAHANFCKFKHEGNECKSKADDLTKAIQNSNDPDELLYYWKEWREKNTKEAMKKMHLFIDLFKKLGDKFGKTPKFAWFADYLDENFGAEMEKVMIELQPLYKELHSYIRYILHEKYGDKVPATGLIPHHLFEQAMAQAWKKDSVIAKDFSGVRMPIENNFKESAKAIMEIASNFMKSLGLSDIPQDFWTSRIKEDAKKGDECSAEVFDSGNTTYFIYCNEVNIRRFLQMHGYMARFYYANERKNNPFAYTDPYNIELALGESVILSASTPKYLHEIGHKDVSVLPENEDMNRLFRMGVHTILSVPEYFVHVKVITDVLDGKVTVEEMNKHYWDLMAKYLGVAPPVERTSESFDFPRKFYHDIEHNKQSTKFVSEIMGYQIYEALCKASGEYIKGDKTLLLHNCNFYKSKEAGKLLQNMMKLGAKKPWKQILGTITGDDSGMKAEAMLEYFEPLQKWLHTKNTEHKVPIGWQ